MSEMSSSAPTREDALAATLSDRFGGPAGEHSGVRPDGTPGGHWWWTPLRVILAVLTLSFALSMVHEKPCIGTAWGNDAVRYSKACYSDIPYLYTGRGFATQQWPYAPHDAYQRMEYPVGTAYFAWFASRVTALAPAGPSTQIRDAAPPDSLWGLPGMTDEVSEYFVITAVLLFGFVLAAGYFLTRADPRRPWDGLMFAASPVLAATALINWDLLAVAATAGALWAWGRGKPVWLGVFIGLGTAFKLYPVLVLGAVIALALRDRSRVRPAAVASAAAILSWVALQIPAWLSSFSAWKYFWSFNATREPDWGSLWLIAQHAGSTYTHTAINLVEWLTMGAICLSVAALAKWAPRQPSLAQLGYLLTVGFLITNKVYSPQYVLWLLPFAVLARPRWRDQLIWQACELTYFFMIWWNFGGYLDLNSGDGFWIYAAAIFIRIAGEIYLVVMILRDLLLSDSADALQNGHAVRGGDQPEPVA
ncbi:MAG: glycosyltransferase family 87 protein [Marmoricola sp.]